MDPSGFSLSPVFWAPFEPEASRLQSGRSTTELWARIYDYEEEVSKLIQKVKGGDPSAGSPTDTL